MKYLEGFSEEANTSAGVKLRFFASPEARITATISICLPTGKPRRTAEVRLRVVQGQVDVSVMLLVPE
ncbi:hypothetical protein PMAYCL1PPCAC_09408, partial [Pristionchus mayeri]